ncbi:MAG TPA: DUF559 domain-containing protein [Thermoleophilaceae bacterium]
MTRDGIPVTTIARTLLDLAAVLNERQLTYAIEQAERQQRFDKKAITEACKRNPRHSGLRALRAAVQAFEPELTHTRSDLEREFVSFCRDWDIPVPAFNVVVCGYTVDAAWQRERLIVELDTRDYHDDGAGFEEDRRRDAELQRRGYRVIRITAKRLREEPQAIAELLRELLAQANAGAPATTRLRPSSFAR